MRAMLLLFLLLLCAPTLTHAQERATVYVEASAVRNKPSMSEAVAATLTKGMTVSVLERVGAWARISSGKTRGWVRASNLTATPAEDVLLSTSPTSPQDSQASCTATRERAAPPRRRADRAAGRGFSVGMLGSATQLDGAGKTLSDMHLSALPLVLLQSKALGLYIAPEFGSGAEYRSTMLGGGLTLRLLTVGRLELRALAGAARYEESPIAKADSTPSFAKWSMRGASVGGLVTVRAFGSVRLGYRGQYVMGFGDQSSARFQRHAFGLIM